MEEVFKSAIFQTEALPLLDSVEVAGEAAILQDVQKLYDSKGEDYCREVFKRQRTLYGAQKDFRRKNYLDGPVPASTGWRHDWRSAGRLMALSSS